jgi:hypothetical protein
MSLTPYDEGSVVVQRTDLRAITSPEVSAKPGAWRAFCNGLRNLFGRRSVELGERYLKAKVRQEEVEAEARLMQATADYELKMAHVRRLDAETDQSLRRVDSLTKILALAKNEKPEAAMARLEEIVRQIEMAGGAIEIQEAREIPFDDSE